MAWDVPQPGRETSTTMLPERQHDEENDRDSRDEPQEGLQAHGVSIHQWR
jgi:hypothetical protein